LPGEFGQVALDRGFPRGAADWLEPDELAGQVHEAGFVRAHPAIVLHERSGARVSAMIWVICPLFCPKTDRAPRASSLTGPALP